MHYPEQYRWIVKAQQQAQQVILDAVPRLRSMGLSVEQIAASLGLAIATVEVCLEANE
jgi:DNA-binding NarL/FixJ family response regulator